MIDVVCEVHEHQQLDIDFRYVEVTIWTSSDNLQTSETMRRQTINLKFAIMTFVKGLNVVCLKVYVCVVVDCNMCTVTLYFI